LSYCQDCGKILKKKQGGIMDKYILPFKPAKNIRRENAPFHKTSKRMENCVDFRMPQGTPILAIADGAVKSVETRFSKNYKDPKYAMRCNFIRIEHENGDNSHYVHIAWRSARVRTGQKVKQGQVIAKSGMTGYSTYPHLHFGLYDKDGKNIKVKFKNWP